MAWLKIELELEDENGFFTFLEKSVFQARLDRRRDRSKSANLGQDEFVCP
jgi:hypothetical protein